MAHVTTARPPPVRKRRAGGTFAFLAILVIAAGCWLEAPAAYGQFLGAPAKRSSGGTSAMRLQKSRGDPNAQMLVAADEIEYDYTNERVSAVGRVQIHYAGSIVEADRIIYDQKTKRLNAEGNVRMTDADGKIYYANALDLGEDFRDGFVDSLRLDAPDKTRIAAVRAERSGGNFTVFQNGVYTACEACKDDPMKPPMWQIKAARIIHDQSEKMIYYEDARIEFVGVPLAYVPFFSSPDPTVKRKTGFLMPWVSYNSIYGFATLTPFYWALAPNYDVTLTPMITSNQGPLMKAEWRHRLMDGSYSIMAAGIFQLHKEQFLATEGPSGFGSGYRDFRGSIQTKGEFTLADNWVWGWTGALVTDKPFLRDYNILPGPAELISQIYLNGRGERSYFDMRAIHYLGLSAYDVQQQIPLVLPVLNYAYTFGKPILGGELAYRVNMTGISREAADFNAITQPAATAGFCTPTADPAVKISTNCLLRGVPGDFARVSADSQWRRSFTDPFGEVFTPFVSVRGDVAALRISPDPGVANYLPTGDNTVVRGMPAAGLEYRYPFISAHSWGTQTIEPIAQVILRPDETGIGKLPNEDAQSLIFSDANVLALDKFSGWDRVEGGSRANAAIQYTAQFNQGGYVNMLVGQSYQLFGKNSFAVADLTNTGLDSGLESRASDYVARLVFQPASNYTFISRFRFDEQTLDIRRVELESRVAFERWSFSVLYGNYDAQPDIGYLTRRQGIVTTGSFKVTQNWSLSGSMRYDLEANLVNATSVGLGYVDDCLAINVMYATSYGFTFNPTPTHAVVLSINLRTLGGTTTTQNASVLAGTATPGTLGGFHF